MEAVRSHWLALLSHGARLGVCASDPRVLARLERRLPYGSRVQESGQRIEAPPALDAVFTLSVGGERTGEVRSHRLSLGPDLLLATSDLDALQERLESELHFSVAAHARTALFVHAGVVAWRGRAILMPGRSMSGKTSLVAALLRAGADYYSDEYAVIDSRGRVHPYPRPLGIRGPDGEARPVAPEKLACRTGGEPLRAALVVATRYAAGARFEPGEAGPTRGLLSLIDNTVVVRERSRFALDCLTLLARDAKTLEGPRGEADEAAAWILRYLDAASRGPEPDRCPKETA